MATRPIPTGASVSGRLPDDPRAFVAAAEKITNERDVEGAAAVYAEDATFEMVTDGVLERYRGRDQIAASWRAVLAALGRRRFSVAKELIAASDGVVVNGWQGSLGGRADGRGIEVWRFDAAGQVREHRLYSYLSVRPATSWPGRLRFALTAPRTAVTLLREQRRAGVRAR